MPTILIVEDNEDIRLNLVEYLEFKNYQTDNTDDGLKALALTIVNKYDLIVLDVMLPGMDGLRLCRELRSRGNTTPIIILSAKDSTDDRIMGLSEGADDYIVKPFCTCLIAYFLDYFADDTPRTLRSSHRAPEFCHFDETI
ncbi:response regulator transcription factor [Parasutterella sp.]|uniref:response regulator transcription factor n=1 Tax=Parasutterella sp. TaxID=2049037 RepID=UPI003AB2732D